MIAPALTEELMFDGWALTPGEVFRPDAERPEYEVLFVGLFGNVAAFADCCGAWTVTLTPKES